MHSDINLLEIVIEHPNGEQENHTTTTAGLWTVGRSAEVDIQLRDPTTSRKHLDIRVHDNRVEIRDQQSSYGVLVNKRPIEASTWHTVAPHDEIWLGDTTLYIRSIDDLTDERHIPSGDVGEQPTVAIDATKLIAQCPDATMDISEEDIIGTAPAPAYAADEHFPLSLNIYHDTGIPLVYSVPVDGGRLIQPEHVPDALVARWQHHFPLHLSIINQMSLALRTPTGIDKRLLLGNTYQLEGVPFAVCEQSLTDTLASTAITPWQPSEEDLNQAHDLTPVFERPAVTVPSPPPRKRLIESALFVLITGAILALLVSIFVSDPNPVPVHSGQSSDVSAHRTLERSPPADER